MLVNDAGKLSILTYYNTWELNYDWVAAGRCDRSNGHGLQTVSREYVCPQHLCVIYTLKSDIIPFMNVLGRELSRQEYLEVMHGIKALRPMTDEEKAKRHEKWMRLPISIRILALIIFWGWIAFVIMAVTLAIIE